MAYANNRRVITSPSPSPGAQILKLTKSKIDFSTNNVEIGSAVHSADVHYVIPAYSKQENLLDGCRHVSYGNRPNCCCIPHLLSF